MGDVLFNKKEHIERVEEFKNILNKITYERNLKPNELLNEVQLNLFYMEKFFKGINTTFPNPIYLKKIAEVSNGITTYEELLRISGYNKNNYIKQVDPVREIRRGDVMWCKLPEGVGSEQGGTRPVIIIQNDIGNKYSPTVIIAPITTQISKAKLKTHVELGQSSGLQKTSVVLFEQLRTVDKSRLGDYIGQVSGKETLSKMSVAYKIAGGCYSFEDQLLEKLETVDENSKTQLGVFKKLFNILFNKYKNKELVFTNNRTA